MKKTRVPPEIFFEYFKKTQGSALGFFEKKEYLLKKAMVFPRISDLPVVYQTEAKTSKAIQATKNQEFIENKKKC